MKLSFSTLGCPCWSWKEICTIAQDLGMDGIEIRGLGDCLCAPELSIFSDEQRDKTMKDLENLSLTIPIISTGAYFADKAKAESSFEEARATVDLADKLGVPYIRVMAEPTAEPQDGDLVLAASLYGQLCDYAKDTKVTPLIETNGKLACSDIMLDFLAKANRPNMGVLWDIHHPYRYYNEAPAKTVSALKDYIRHVHIKDSVMNNKTVEYRMMGYGDVPLQDALTELSNAGYKGFVSLEWVKRWNPNLEEPGTVFAHFSTYMRFLLNRMK